MDFDLGLEKVDIKDASFAKEHTQPSQRPAAGGISQWLHTVGLALASLLASFSLSFFLVWIIKRSACFTDVVELCLNDRKISGCEEVLYRYQQCSPSNLLLAWILCLALAAFSLIGVCTHRTIQLQNSYHSFEAETKVIGNTEAAGSHAGMAAYSMSRVRDNDLFCSEASDLEDEINNAGIINPSVLEMASPTDSMASL